MVKENREAVLDVLMGMRELGLDYRRAGVTDFKRVSRAVFEWFTEPMMCPPDLEDAKDAVRALILSKNFGNGGFEAQVQREKR